ncbi:MAG: hypothetical protein V3T30_06820 [Thermodesulfobacteriota bacterium]
MKKDNEEIMELKHEAKPGYKKIFLIVFALMILYLAVVFSTG